MNIPNNLNIDRIYKELEKKAPTLGTLYGILAPLVATKGAGEDAFDAISREITAVIENPQMPTLNGVRWWWMSYGKETAKNGFLAFLAGELLGNKKISTAGVNVIKGTLASALIGDIGIGGGAPYLPEHFTNGAQPIRPSRQPRPRGVAGNPMLGVYAR